MRGFALTVASLALLSSSAPAAGGECGPGEGGTSGGVILSFDDHAIASWYAARPLFDRYGAKATFFVDRYHKLSANERAMVRALNHDGHEIAAHSYTHGDAATFAPADYVDAQIDPQLAAMAVDGIHPRNFAYPFGYEVCDTTGLLFRDFGFVRDTTNRTAVKPGAASRHPWSCSQTRPDRPDVFVSCEERERFIGGFGTDLRYTIYGISLADFDTLFDEAACRGTNVVLYGHEIRDLAEGEVATEVDGKKPPYITPPSRLERIMQKAATRGLAFRRVKDICQWGAARPGAHAWTPVFASPRRFDEVRFADFDGDGDDDAFRSNGRQWRLLENHGGSFTRPAQAERWRYLNTSAIPFDNLAFGDFDGDGRADLNGNGTTDVFVESGGRWYFSEGARLPWAYLNHSGFEASQLRFADLDGDGCDDVIRVKGGRLAVSWCGVTAWQLQQRVEVPLKELGFADVDPRRPGLEVLQVASP